MQGSQKQKVETKTTAKPHAQNKASESGVRFASNASVKVASSWMISRYAGTFKRLAQ
jgi:hypothetical protein